MLVESGRSDSANGEGLQLGLVGVFFVFCFANLRMPTDAQRMMVLPGSFPSKRKPKTFQTERGTLSGRLQWLFEPLCKIQRPQLPSISPGRQADSFLSGCNILSRFVAFLSFFFFLLLPSALITPFLCLSAWHARGIIGILRIKPVV